tara:strand:- start:7 stop:876 length:870 start_codon:yes stop_codon:yes gene_type:complete
MSKVYLTIDFEDFSYDLKRSFGIKENRLNTDALYSTFLKIDAFCEKHLANQKITFFCTGVIAEKYPEIISEISKKGHEVACHSFFHERVNSMQLNQFEYDIQKATEILEKYSNQKTVGFRAPFFSINTSNWEYYQIIQKYFEYDSSLHFNQLEEVEKFKSILKIDKLKLLPVPSVKISSFLHLKLGGTAFKIMPLNIINKLIQNIFDKKLIPIIYLHPYEFFDDFSFYVPKHELAELSFLRRNYWALRQYQWHKLGNKNVIPKLIDIFDNFEGGNFTKNIINAYEKENI